MFFLLFYHQSKFYSRVVCSALDEMIEAGSPPDLVLDLTNGGLESEAVKSLTRDLGLPTLTTSMGGLGDIRE